MLELGLEAGVEGEGCGFGGGVVGHFAGGEVGCYISPRHTSQEWLL